MLRFCAAWCKRMRDRRRARRLRRCSPRLSQLCFERHAPRVRQAPPFVALSPSRASVASPIAGPVPLPVSPATLHQGISPCPSASVAPPEFAPSTAPVARKFSAHDSQEAHVVETARHGRERAMPIGAETVCNRPQDAMPPLHAAICSLRDRSMI